jgi:CopA family copper-resistance protein
MLEGAEMNMAERSQIKPRMITRRRFVQGVAAGAVAAGCALWRIPGMARAGSAVAPILAGRSFDLAIENVPVNFTGRPSFATAVNGLVPGPILRWREGDTVKISVTNHLPEYSSIHWHGIRLPSDMDGVPGLSFSGIAPGQTFVYQFPVRQQGTYWYHSHSRFQEQTGHYGALIVDPSGTDSIKFDCDYVILLSDWTDENPETVFTNLKMQSGYYNYHQRTLGTFYSDLKEKGLRATISDRLAWGRMNMSPTDILDVSGATYTYLINGNPPAANWTALYRPRERVRLRFINASSMTIFDVRIPNLPMTVVQADGNDVEPVTVDEFRISVAETYDVIVQPEDASAFTIFAQSEDRTGYARATLAARSGMTAPVPAMDPRPLLTMVDMGMSTSGANMAGLDNMGPMAQGSGAPMSTPESGASPKSHSAKVPLAANMHAMPGMTMASPPGTHSETMTAVASSDPPGQPGPGATRYAPPSFEVPGTIAPAHPIPIRPGPEVDNIAAAPSERLSDPGVGLNNNGRRVLTYAALRARYPGTDTRPPGREIELHLTGNMQRFIWGFDGEKFSEAAPIRLTLGERVRIVLVNDTMMAHPIHLHGLWSELENNHGEFRPYKHTINVKPGERLSYLVTADMPGSWAYHCHLLYHMESGMFRAVVVS